MRKNKVIQYKDYCITLFFKFNSFNKIFFKKEFGE